MNNWTDATNDDINRAIAEKIFGWRVFRPSDVKWRSKYDADSYAHSTAYMYLTGKKRPSTHMIDAKLLPRFTEDLNAAFAVQAVAVKKGRNVYLSALHGRAQVRRVFVGQLSRRICQFVGINAMNADCQNIETSCPQR